MAFANKAFSNATGIARRSGVLPEDATSPQRSIDILRGKRRTKGGSIFARSFQRATRSSQPGQQAESGVHLTL